MIFEGGNVVEVKGRRSNISNQSSEKGMGNSDHGSLDTFIRLFESECSIFLTSFATLQFHFLRTADNRTAEKDLF